MNNVITMIGVTTVIALIFLPLLFWRSRLRCPECGSRKIGVEKTVTGMQTFDYHSSSESGGTTSVQMQYTVKYHCDICRAQWNTTETETH